MCGASLTTSVSEELLHHRRVKYLSCQSPEWFLFPSFIRCSSCRVPAEAKQENGCDCQDVGRSKGRKLQLRSLQPCTQMCFTLLCFTALCKEAMHLSPPNSMLLLFPPYFQLTFAVFTEQHGHCCCASKAPLILRAAAEGAVLCEVRQVASSSSALPSCHRCGSAQHSAALQWS